MKIKKAYQLIDLCLLYNKAMSENPKAYDEAIRLTKEVFNKQYPTKPVHKEKNFYCANCDHWLLWDDVIPNEWKNYCAICGQKIDWTEVET